MWIEGGNAAKVSHLSPVGTRIEVSDLFYNVHRRKFLKTVATEFSQIKSLFWPWRSVFLACDFNSPITDVRRQFRRLVISETRFQSGEKPQPDASG